MGFIYKITNDINDKIYIGQTINSIDYRFNCHINEAKNDVNKQNKFHQALLNIGPEHFKVELIEECPDEDLNDKEKYWIKFYNSVNCGYNTTWGGSCGFHYDREEILNLWNQGLNIQKISDKIGIDRGLLAEILKTAGISQEEIYLKRNQSNYKQVYQINPTTGEVIKKWNSIKEAALTYKILQDNIVKCCRLYPNAKTAAKYAWRYVKDYNPELDRQKLIQYTRHVGGRKKTVLQYDRNYNLINSFESTRVAEENTHINKNTIARYCRGERKDPKGFIWQYKNN